MISKEFSKSAFLFILVENPVISSLHIEIHPNPYSMKCSKFTYQLTKALLPRIMVSASLDVTEFEFSVVEME